MEMGTENTAMETPRASDADEKPLLNLIKNLVSVSNSESNTMVDNSQLLEILQKEFNMLLQSQAELDTDIFLNVLKKFLKGWPRWDEFDKLMKENTDPAAKEALMLDEYNKLKEYLRHILDFTKTQMAGIISKISIQKTKYKTESDAKNKSRDLVMKVCCSRDQLYRLFYRKPHPNTLTIFNIADEPTASKISLDVIRFKEVLNWPHVNITVSLPNFEFLRKNSSDIKRILVNRKLQTSEPEATPLSGKLYWRTATQRNKLTLRKNILISYLVQLIKYVKENKTHSEEWRAQLVDLFTEIKGDLLMLNNNLVRACDYQYFLSKYPYVRYHSNPDYSTEETLPVGNTEKLKECINPNDFDLHLEETLSPAMMFQVPKFAVNYSEDKSGRVFKIDYPCFMDVTSNWLRLECSWCEVKFDGFLTVYNIVQHFNENHSNEPDWQCAKCKNTFTMNHLAANRWAHTC